MSSPARLAANAANAQLSTGPKTPEGKKRSARNALKHGLTARELIIRDDERQEFEEFEAALILEVDPQGPLEQVAFAQVLHAAWNFRRVRHLEAELFNGDRDPLLDDSLEKTLDRIGRYHTRIERSYHRALRELRNLQGDRSYRCTFDLGDAPGEIPFFTNTAEWIKRTQPGGRISIRLIDKCPAPLPVSSETAPKTPEKPPKTGPQAISCSEWRKQWKEFEAEELENLFEKQRNLAKLRPSEPQTTLSRCDTSLASREKEKMPGTEPTLASPASAGHGKS